MFIENRLTHLATRLRNSQPTPLRLSLWNGHSLDFGPDPKVTIVVPQKRVLRCLLPPDLMKLGEAYVEGRIRVEGSLRDIFEASARFVQAAARPDRIGRLLRAVNHTAQSDRRAIQYHYDVSNAFYRLFLDRNMVYSCAYFRSDADTLDQAQEQKLDYILTKLRVPPGQRLLDIGCGWGALIMRAAAKYGCIATGVTLSRNQYELARERIRAEGLEGRCEVRLQDYRDVPEVGGYDRIASVGMFEHVGLKQLGAYFRKVESLLAEGGVALNHGITAAHPDNRVVGMGVGAIHRQIRLSRRRAAAHLPGAERNVGGRLRSRRCGEPAAPLRPHLRALGREHRAQPRRGAYALPARSATASGRSTLRAAPSASRATG